MTIKKSVLESLALVQANMPLTTKALAEMADEYWKIYQERLSADKAAAALKVEEVQLSAAIISQLQGQEATTIGGKAVKLEIKESQQPHVTDWPKFYAYILKKKDFSLLERRPGKAAVKERWEAGQDIPGVEKFPTYTLSKSQVKG